MKRPAFLLRWEARVFLKQLRRANARLCFFDG